jgi:hypothetical protein
MLLKPALNQALSAENLLPNLLRAKLMEPQYYRLQCYRQLFRRLR